jgi:hypothetical protein
MKKIIFIILLLNIAWVNGYADTNIESQDINLNKKVIVGNDTVGIIIPERNFGRYDRGLYNYLYIPKGQWAFGLTASYGEFNSEDVQLLSVLKDLDFNGKLYSIKPSISYFFRNNQSIGLKFNYTRGFADLASLSMDFDDDLNFSIKDVSYYSQTYAMSIFYRNYIGLSTSKRFAVFNDIDLSFGSGSARFKRYYNDEPKDTRTVTTEAKLNFSPGVCVFIMDYAAFNISFGVFGINMTKQSQTTNGMEDGSRFTSGANFKFNVFNINFGLAIVI